LAKTLEDRPRAGSPRPAPAALRTWSRAAYFGVASLLSLLLAAGSVYGIALYRYADSQFGRLEGPGKEREHEVVNDELGLCARGTCSYLVIGNDSRRGLSEEEQIAFGNEKTVPGQRSDTIMLVRIDARSRQAVVLSFPRDLWVDIPRQGKSKIALAYEGGPVRVAEVVEALTGLQVNHYLSVDLAGFEGVVDALGGVPICVNQQLIDPLSRLNLPAAGCYQLDGRQALAFVRARHVCGEKGIPDFNRISRQQQFLRAVLAKVLRPQMVLRAPDLIRRVAGNLLVDRALNLADVIYLSRKLQGVSTGAVDFRSVPTVGDTVQTDDGEVAVLRATPEARELFRRLRDGRPLGELGRLQALTPPSPAVVKVRVFDASSGGKAGKVHAFLATAGFEISSTLGADTLRQSRSAIVYVPGKRQEAEVVQGFLRGLPVVEASPNISLSVDVAVVVTATYEGPGLESPAPAPSTPPPGSGPPECP
jgi:LCP family protein required for cell wall assembly